MGYTTILDILGSMVIGGILMITAWRLSDAATNKTYNNGSELTLQQNLVTVAEILENDFRKIGYASNPNSFPTGASRTKSIPYADTSSIWFYTDICTPNNPFGDGSIDSIHYYLGPISECANTPNPRDRILYRVVNTETPMPCNLGVTQFYMVYYDYLSDSMATPITREKIGEIKTIEINITVENVSVYDTAYSSAFWKQIRLASRNVNAR
jgi:hypothetical protein